MAKLIQFLAAIFISGTLIAQPSVSMKPVITTGLNQPIQFVNAGNGSNKVYIVQKTGTIRVYDASLSFIKVFLTVTGISTSGEQGLLSMAFHPQYAANGFFYVYYVATGGSLELARYHVSAGDPDIADPASKVVLITIPHPTNTNHNGGELHFGNDGFLYLSTGDGGGGGDVPNNAQNTSVLLGKLLRFNVNISATPPYYSLPATNPYGNEIYDLGLRNPFRWSFDSQTHDIWIGDVGQDSWEEVNFRAAGAAPGVNYGWRCYEGNNTYNTSGCGPIGNYVFPAHTYPTQNPSAAITGGVVYRGTQFPSLQGVYLSADFYSGIWYKIVPNGAAWTVVTETLAPTGIADFGETEAGEVYTVSLTTNTVHHVVLTGSTPVSLSAFNGTVTKNGVDLYWTTTSEINTSHFEIEYGQNGTSFTFLANIPARNIANGAAYLYTHTTNIKGPVFYRLKMVDQDGSISYSNVIRLDLNASRSMIQPTLIADRMLRLKLSATEYYLLQVINSSGAIVLKKDIRGMRGDVQLPLLLPAGMYMVKFTGEGLSKTERITLMGY